MPPRKGKRKQQQQQQQFLQSQHDDSVDVKQNILPDANGLTEADAAAIAQAQAARFAATQASQLTDPSLTDQNDTSLPDSFNLFDQSHLSAARAVSALRARHDGADDDPNEMTSQATDGLMQLANATQAMTGLEGRRTFAEDGYVSAEPASPSFVDAREHLDTPVDSGMEIDQEDEGQQQGQKKRKRGPNKKDKAPNKRLQVENAEGGGDPHDPNANPAEFPTAGPFTESEKEIVGIFADRFREENSLDVEVLNNLVQNKERKMDELTRSFWTQIYTILPNRDNKAMQRHVRRRFHNYTVRGKWTNEDDEALKEAYDSRPNQWTRIGEMLQRMPEDCRDRWRNYVVCGDARKVDQWHPHEEENLSIAVHECIQKIKDDALAKARQERTAFRDDQDWESMVNFNIVSEKLSHSRSRIQCLQHWKAMQIREAEGRTKRKMKRPRGETAAKVPRGGRNMDTPKQHFKKMKPGDKHTILKEILENDVYEESNAPWTLMAQRSNLTLWNAQDRKYLWNRLKKDFRYTTDSSFREQVGESMAYFEKTYPGDLDQYYNPDLDATDGAMPSVESGNQRPGTPGLLEPKSEPSSSARADNTNIDPRLGGPNNDKGNESEADAAAEADIETSPTQARPPKKRGRGPGKKARKSGKAFKSADRIDDGEADPFGEAGSTRQQQPAPTAMMVSSSSVPANPYEAQLETVDRIYKKKAQRGRRRGGGGAAASRAPPPPPPEQDDSDSEPELPARRRDFSAEL